MASSAALKVAAAWMLLMCVGSDLTGPALASSPDDREEVAGELLLRELVEHELAEELGLLGMLGQHRDRLDVGDVCSPVCQTCLIVCAVTCVLNKEPIACFANCTVSSNCFGKPVAAAAIGEVSA